MDAMTFSALILAGGKSSRMCQDKAWLRLRHETFLARQIRLAQEVGASEVLISGRATHGLLEVWMPRFVRHGLRAASPAR